MATVNKDFKVKNGLIVEGTTGTIDNYDILTKKQDDQDYIIGLIGGSAVSTNTPDTVVLRDNNGSFAGEVITAENHFVGDITGDVTGTVSDISNHNTDDLSEGTTNKYYTDGRVKDVLTGSTQSNISITEIAGVLHITAENGVADSTTDDLDEGTTNKYFTEARVRDALTGGDGISFNGTTGDIAADVAGGLEITGGQIVVDRDTVDGWYDANGAAGDVATDLTNHMNDTSAHGTTGDVVGTTDSQTLTNKTIGDILTFNDGSNNSTIDVDGNDLYINANNNLTLSTANGDIVLNPDGNAYIGSASAGNEIATNGYVDNAVSGLNWKQAVNLLYDDSTPTLSGTTTSTPLVIDGHAALGSGEAGIYRILVQNGNDAGIYLYNQSGTSWTLDRTADADTYEELVGAAVFVMEGTQYGQTSWVQSNHYLSAFTGQSWTQFSGTGSVVAGTGITVDGLEVSVDRTTVDTWYDAAGTASSEVGTHAGLTTTHGVTGNIVGTSDSQTLTNKTIDGGDNTLQNIPNAALDNDSITVNGQSTALGSSVTLDTDDVSEGATNQYFTSQRVRDVLTGSTQTNISITEVSGQLIVTAENGVDDSTTDDLDEGVTNHYFTDGRAKDAAADLLTNATKTNITITGTGSGLTITAENGVADSTTDDLTEGSTNLYFTDQRAVDALENVVPNFTEVDINSLAKQVAVQTGNIATASTTTVYSWPKADFRSAKLLIKTAYGSHTELTEVLLTLDSSDNIAITEYATVGTNGSSMSVSADIDMGNVRLRVSTVNNNSVVTVTGTLLA